MTHRSSRSSRPDSKHQRAAQADTSKEAREPTASEFESQARAIAFRKLNAAPQTRAQLAAALEKKGIPADIATCLLNRFEEVGLVDDWAYAQMLVRSKHREKGLARRALSMELHKRGIDKDTAERALSAIDEGDELERALELVARKLASTRSIDPIKRKRRILGQLARKGYSPAIAYKAISEGLAAEGQAAAEQLEAGED